MGMVLHPLFHWSPAERRASIARRGLRTGRPPTCSTEASDELCLSLSPSQAWSLSAAVFGQRGQEWDLWQVVLDVDDEVVVRPFHGNRLGEIRVRNNVPRSRLWLVGTRSVPLRGKRW